MKQQTFKRLITICSILCGLSACSEPEYQPNRSPYTYKESYSVDIAMLSEWAGRILPEHNTFLIRKRTEGDKTSCIYGLELEKIDENCVYTDLLTNKTSNTSNDLNRLSNIVCKECDAECTDDFCAKCAILANKDPLKSDEDYVCAYDTSGGAVIYDLWETLKDKESHTPQLRIGNGDSFGVSAAISSNFADLPTAIMLNVMGFDVDTLGNHSFDQQLSYLQNVISHAKYQYVSSNSRNVPQNLEGVAPYSLIRLDTTDTQAAPPILAIVSALDMEANETVYPGRFGTLETGDYCDVIHAIEMAYNHGARSFMVLGHILTDSNSMIALFNALFSFADDHYKVFDAKQIGKILAADNSDNVSDIATTCKSRIEVPSEMLTAVFNQDNLNAIDLSKSENQEKYNILIRDIRKDIFNGIIGVFGEGSVDPRLVSFRLPDTIPNAPIPPACGYSYSPDFNNSIEYYPNGCITISDDTTENWTFTNAFINNNKLPYFNRNYNNKPITSDGKSPNIQNPPCYDNDTSLAEFFRNIQLPACHKLVRKESASEHAIWLIQMPSYGSNTAQIHIDIEGELGASDKQFHYTSNLTEFDLRPVLSSPVTSNKNTEITSEYCTEDVKRFQSVNGKTNSCITLYTNDNTDDANDQDLIDECLEYITSQSMTTYNSSASDQNAKSHSEFVQEIENMLECIYQPMIKFKCTDNSSAGFSYVERPYFEFQTGFITNSTLSEDRSASTFRTSLATTSVLRSEEIQEANNPAVLINAGAIKPVEVSKLNVSVLKELAPFGNTMVPVQIFPMELKDIIEEAIKSQTDKSASDFGGFPAFAGLHISVGKSSTAENKLEIKEMWQTDKEEKLERPLLIKLDNNDEPLCGRNCVFAEYTLDNRNNPVTLQTSEKNDQQYATSTHSFTMTKSSDGYLIAQDSDNNPVKLTLYVTDYILNGGDGYTFSDDAKNASVQNSKSIDDTIKSYLGIKQPEELVENQETTGILCEEYNQRLSIYEMQLKSQDNILPTQLACVLSVRRYYNIDLDPDETTYYLNEEIKSKCSGILDNSSER